MNPGSTRPSSASSDPVDPRELISAKKAGEAHDGQEVREFVRAYVEGSVPDYQMAAWLMAVWFKGLDPDETFALTEAIAHSGRRLDFSDIAPVVADKHSSGGVGDKITLVLAPLLWACGLPCAKMSGRALGHTGGTIDKLESIPGVRTDLSAEDMRRQVAQVGVAVSAHTEDLAPADRLLYALRDRTETVDQDALIASSIMGKKLAGGADVVVLDLKVGRGAFIGDVAAARRTGRLMEEIGAKAGLRVRTVITAMDEPLGRAVGTLLEVREAMAVLGGEGPADVRTVSVRLAAHLLAMGGVEADIAGGARRAEHALDSGTAREAAERWLRAQGATRIPTPGEDAPPTSAVQAVPAPRAGWISGIDARAIGRIAHLLGRGRSSTEACIDPLAGIVISAARGDEVGPGDPLAHVHAAGETQAADAVRAAAGAFEISDVQPEERRLILEESPL